MPPPTRVLFVMGHGWSGSTILGNTLGEIDGFFHAGELRRLWGEALPSGEPCGCGKPFRGCPVWSPVIEQTLASVPGGDAETIARWHRQAVRVRNAPRLLRMRPGHLDSVRGLRDYGEVLSRLYANIADVTAARVVVDTSKRAGDAALLLLLPSVEPSFVHLVRDPRAVAYSWRKRGGRGPAATSRDWVAYNLLDEAVRRKARGRALLVRYEDLVANPRQTLRRITAAVDERHVELPLVGERTVRLGPNHTVEGNPVRFATGDVELREDDAWRRELPAAARASITALTAPLLLRYGYPLRG